MKMAKRTFIVVLTLNLILNFSALMIIFKSYNYNYSGDYDNNDELWNLTIIHTNDVHSRYDQINDAATGCTNEQEKKFKCYGGVARHKTVIDDLRKKNKNSLLLDGGDQFQGKYIFIYIYFI